ncbi:MULTISPECIES: hypothetical protein [unclassified Bradyrhizobium]|uniref:hypothetical protein n=1 Tax=unclassified Bradyrhizobium TaxID=2631580 RepID=UPI000417DA4B|nr:MULTISPECIES: hypothetical protein [unclassified Bradyrhizobium]QIG92954.1 hypothetical protein G6P99_10880 [Bradyrhizobium sp. 6(2017)]
MSTKFTKPILTISLLTSLVAMSATAHAGASTSAASRSVYHPITAQHAPRDAYAAIGWTAEPAAGHAGEVNAWRYSGGPKSSVPPSHGF